MTHESALGFWRDVFGDTRSTILPDRLDRSPRAAEFDAVPAGGSLTLPDATRPITVYTDPTTHAVDTAMTYIQDSRTLFINGDSYTPGNPPGAGGRALNDNISARAIAVSQIVAAHGPADHVRGVPDRARAALAGEENAHSGACPALIPPRRSRYSLRARA